MRRVLIDAAASAQLSREHDKGRTTGGSNRAVKSAGKTGKVKIVCFDEDADTLAGVADGFIYGTVVQQPYEWGYQGMKLMAKYIESDKSGIPANGIIIVPGKVIDKSNVDDFMAQMKQMLHK